MSTEYYLYDKDRNEVICLRDVIKESIYQKFVTDYIHPNDHLGRDNLSIILDDSVDCYDPFPSRVKL